MAAQTNLNKKRSLGYPGSVPESPHVCVGDDTHMVLDTPPEVSVKRPREEFEFQGCPPQLVEALVKQMETLNVTVQKTLSAFQPQGTENKPWAAEWKAGKLYLAIPLSGMSAEANLLDQVILQGISEAKTRVCLTPGQGIESVPELSVEDERFLNGVLTAFASNTCPRTLKCGGSSITDLSYHMCWNLAASRLVNDKDARGFIHPSVLPEKPVGGGSASEYLSKRIAALKATLGSEHSHIARTVEKVIKLWTEEKAPLTKESLQLIKIPWGLVQSKGGEHQEKEIKVKGSRAPVKVRNLVTPINPKDSAWVMPYERKLLSHLCAPIWGRMSKLSDEWKKLDGPGTHSSYDAYVSHLRGAYANMRSLSDSMTKRLGLRKAVIFNSKPIKALSKKQSAEMTSNQKVILFAKSDLTSLPEKAKAVFEPFWVGENLPQTSEVADILKGENYKVLLKQADNNLLESFKGLQKVLVEWECRWLTSFAPSDKLSFKDIPQSVVETQNLFNSLADMADD